MKKDNNNSFSLIPLNQTKYSNVYQKFDTLQLNFNYKLFMKLYIQNIDKQKLMAVFLETPQHAK